MSQENNIDFNNILIGSFSTNKTKKAPLSIIKLFTEKKECFNINQEKNEKLEFSHKILNSNGEKIGCKNIFIEINISSKKQKIYNLIDCFMIFFDLENNNSLVELDKILLYLNTIDIINKKIYLINYFIKEENIKKDLTEDKIKSYFEKYTIDNYDISSINLENSNDDLSEIIDSINMETLEGKNIIIDNLVIKRGNKDLKEGESNSKCFIF